MVDNQKLFDAATSKLHPAINLVEASAGTGKTYAIAMMVLRFVTELSFPLDTILIVTFTKAATQELAARVRLRLVEARDLLMDLGQQEDVDPTLRRWADRLEKPALALERIRVALNDIDNAAIFTIHGFCQRMLKEQALESGQLFDVELKTDIEQIRMQVAEDFWRQNFYKLPPFQCGLITAEFNGPAELYNSVRPVPGYGARLEPNMGTIVEAGGRVEQCYQAMSSWWLLNSETVLDSLNQLIIEKKVKSEFIKEFSSWWQNVDSYFKGQQDRPPKNLHHLSREGFATVINGSRVRGKKKDELLASLNLPDTQMVPLLRATKELQLVVRVSFAQYLASEIDKRMQQENIMSYNDLITRLHRIVTEPNGQRLRDILRQRFHAALIDEFQDTDIEQWQIFSTVFGRGTYLYLIGDPKQAIYRFRGADINSYFLARKASSSILTLERNYRSHPKIVNETNRIFSSRENPFVYDDSLLGFSPVSPAKKSEDGYLSRNGSMLDNIAYCQLAESPETKDGRWTSGKASTQILKFVVKETHKLLKGDVILSLENNEKRLLQPHDIAILVRNNSHAEAYLECFVRAGIPAVISNKKSIYQTDECVEMYTFLQSLLKTSDVQFVKKAMTISWFALTGNALYDIWQSEDAFDSWYSRFQDYAEIWHDRGFLPMINRFLQVEKVFHNLGTGPLAERTIANINQLLEVVQEVEFTNGYGPDQTLQWLGRSMVKQESEDELRLESDEEAVRIVTMHGAKGLEYPVVFCPFLWYRQARLEREKNRVACHENGVLVVDLGSDQFEKRRTSAAQEEFAEDLRLLYVAMTRAKLLSYIVWCDMKGSYGGAVDSFSSPLGYLLFPEGRVPFEEQQQRLQSFCNESSFGYSKITADEDHSISYNTDMIQSDFSFRKPIRSSFHTNWQMTSYSALASISQHHEEELHSTVENLNGSEIVESADLPAGANFGNAVHDILEKISFYGLLQPDHHRQLILQICKKYGIDADIVLLEKLLKNIVETPLLLPNKPLDKSLHLAGIDESKCVKEMMFYFHLQRGETRDINNILAREVTVVPLSDKVVEGYLTGFIDLVFEHNNKFYIVDYKTNHLGANLHNYSQVNLVEAMASHNYGLQFWLYSLVLHRHLINFLPDYQYEKHFGGVFYLFVRGMQYGSDSGTFFARPDLETLLRLDGCLGGSR